MPQPYGGRQLRGEAREPGVVHGFGSSGLPGGRAPVESHVFTGALTVLAQDMGEGHGGLVRGVGCHRLGAIGGGHVHRVALGVIDRVDGDRAAVDAVGGEGRVGGGHLHGGGLLRAQGDRRRGGQGIPGAGGDPELGGQIGDVADIHLLRHLGEAHVNGHGGALDDVVVATLTCIGIADLPCIGLGGIAGDRPLGGADGGRGGVEGLVSRVALLIPLRQDEGLERRARLEAGGALVILQSAMGGVGVEGYLRGRAVALDLHAVIRVLTHGHDPTGAGLNR